MRREEILDKAKEQVCGHRTEDYGTPENSFKLIADLWTAYLTEYKLSAFSEISSKDVAVMMALMKIARIRSDIKSDSYIDLAGYAACAGEIGIEEIKAN